MSARLQAWRALWVLRARYPQHWVTALLLTLIVMRLGALGFELRAFPNVTRSLPDADVASAHTRPRPGADVQAISAAHLFGIATRPNSSPVDTPDSRSQLILTATLATSDSKSGYALISSNGQGALYHAGSSLTGEPNVQLAEIYPNHVVLMRAGVAEALWFNKDHPHVAKVAPSIPASISPEEDEKRRFAGTIKLEHGPFDPDKPAAPYPTKVITKLRVMPVIMDNHLLGYTVDPQDANAVKGLPDRAIITSVNGTLLDSGPTTQRAFDELAEAGSASFTVRDGDTLKVISVDLSGLAAALVPRRRPIS